MLDRRTLAVGTTTDYVDLIRRSYPGRTLFVSHSINEDVAESHFWHRDEITCDLTDYPEVFNSLRSHLDNTEITPSGLACFDCESLDLAAYLAEKLGLPFPSREAVTACRNKYVTRKTWKKAGVPCPDADPVYCLDNVLSIFDKRNRPIILKPLTGTGSELVFKCKDREECAKAFSTLQKRISRHSDDRLYPAGTSDHLELSPRKVFIAEESVDGLEFSCDFEVNGESIEIIRFARKLHAPSQVFGTTWAYVIPAMLPKKFNLSDFKAEVLRATRALKLTRSICMLDFMVVDDKAIFLELSPRPGGDCLPELMLQSGKFDIIAFALNFADGLSHTAPDYTKWNTCVGLRLFASQEGTITRLSHHLISSDSRARDIKLRHGVGHRVVLTPYDYDSRILGHVIFRPNDVSAIPYECHDISTKLKIEMEEELCRAPKAS